LGLLLELGKDRGLLHLIQQPNANGEKNGEA